MDLVHTVQEKDFSPECMCCFKLSSCVKNFVHTIQRNGVSPECVLMCCFKLLPTVKNLEHRVQENFFFFKMCSHVCLETTTHSKGFCTWGAGIRFFFRMRFRLFL